MANLLAGVNAVLEKATIINKNHSLTSLTNSGKQTFIDNAVSSWNEAVDQIYSKSNVMRPDQGEEDSITLVEDKRNYSLPDDLVQLHWPLHDETNGRYINKYPGGYEELRNVLIQPENYSGPPTSGAISPIDSDLYLNYLPTSGEAGDIYKFFYWKDTVMSRSSDVFPFSDTVYRALVPVVTQLFKYNQNNIISEDVRKLNYGRAVRALKKEPMDTAYIKRYGGRVITSPLGFDPFTQ